MEAARYKFINQNEMPVRNMDSSKTGLKNCCFSTNSTFLREWIVLYILRLFRSFDSQEAKL
jgi:hypothetical protein